MSLTVAVPPGFEPEKRYVFDVLLARWLGLDFAWRVRPGATYDLELADGARLSIRDAFFGRLDPARGYLDRALVPASVARLDHALAPEPGFPVLFGAPRVAETAGAIEIDADLVAGVFFGLSRWEEAVVAERDLHDRVPSSVCLAGRAGLLARAWVNETLELLWSALARLGLGAARKERRFEIVPTHDLDLLRYAFPLRALAGDLVKRRDPLLACRRVVARARGFGPALRDLMDASEARGLRSRFYVLAAGRGGPGARDADFTLDDRGVRPLLAEMVRRGHVVGYHPGYGTFADAAAWAAQRRRLEDALGAPVREGRQHFLRFRVPDTWRIWDEAGMDVDSSMSYADHDGFRCGTADEFPVFDVGTRRALRLVERPLVAMEGSLFHYRGLGPGEGRRALEGHLQTCRRYRMPYTVLFHNSFLGDPELRAWWPVYRELLDLATRG